MRKITATILALTLAVGLTACGGTSDTSPPPVSNAPSSSSNASTQESNTTPPQSSTSEHTDDTALSSTPAEENSTPEASGKILIAYFSRMGNMDFDSEVDAVASATVQADGSEYVGNNKIIADMVAEKTGGDLFFIEQTEKYPSAYRATTDQAKEEQNSGTRPALVAQVENMEQYSTVILVYPNWWGTLPPAVCTFLEGYDFSEKTILPLATHEGSGLGSGPSDIESLCPDATLLEGLSVRGSAVKDAKASIDTWIDRSGITTPIGAQVRLTFGENEALVTLMDNATTRDFISKLPLTQPFEDFNSIEKICRLPETLSVEGVEQGVDPAVADITLYVPWNTLVFYYEDFGYHADLIPVGRVEAGMDLLEVQTEDFSVTMELITGFEEATSDTTKTSDAVQSTDITLTVGDTLITATLDDSETSKAFLATLPRTISMSEYGEREYYGRIEAISENGTSIPDFENGDVTYYLAGPSFAVFYANSDQSDLGGLIRMGKITSDLAVFEGLGESVEMQITLTN